MKIEKQVISYDIAVQLKDLGVTQAMFGQYHVMDFEGSLIVSHVASIDGNPIAAFSVAELGVMIPPNTALPELVSQEYCYEGQIVHMWSFKTMHGYINCATEADARGMLLIYLLTKVCISVKEVNNRLEKA